MEKRNSSAGSDEELVRNHVISLFDAYIAGDVETLRSGRTADWKGFQIRSTRLIQGVDEYMKELEKVMGGLKVARYEFVDFEVEVNGDIALVYYVARDYLERESDDKPRTVLIRSLDVYARRHGAWIQTGSNISSIADVRDASDRPAGR